MDRTSALPSCDELPELHAKYLLMTGHKAQEPWSQAVYDRLVMGLISHYEPPTPEHTTAWMETQSGLRFNPTDAQPRVSLKDMMWGVARFPRYNGQFSEEVDHYSVAEHLVLLVEWVLKHVYSGRTIAELKPHELKELRTLAMLDIQEGVIGDMTRPMKKVVPQFGKVEDRFCRVLAERFDLIFPLPGWIKDLDNRIIADERRQAMNESGNAWASDDLEPLGVKLQFWTPRQAFARLRAIYVQLGISLNEDF